MAVSGTAVDLTPVRPRGRTVLRFLALRAGVPVHRDVLVSALWPDTEPEPAYRSLQVAVSNLRHLLEPDVSRGQSTFLTRLGDTYRLTSPPGSRCDVLEFEGWLTRADQSRRARDVAGEVQALRSALNLYAGELLPEEGMAEWVLPARDRLRLMASDAAERLARVRVGPAGGGPAGGRQAGSAGTSVEPDVPARQEALGAVRRSLALDPYRDSAWRLLVQLHEQAGDVAAAQSARLQRRRVLAELGLDLDG